MMFRSIGNPRRLVYLILLTCFLYGIVQIVRNVLDGSMLDIDRSIQLKEIMEEFNQASKHNVKNVGQVCRHPTLSVYAPEIMKFIRNEPKFHCGSEKDWVEIIGSTALISEDAKKIHGDIECTFTDIIRNNEYTTRDGATTSTHTQYQLESSDFVKVYCEGSDGNRWNSVLAGIRHSEDIMDRIGWDQVPSEALGMNVLMWGFDSTSRNNFIRKLPRSYKYLKDTLGALVLEGYNIVGDGTPQALIPMLTGQTELELPETRKRKRSKASFVDVYPFIWNDFRANGYATGYTEDQAEVGTFTYRLKGFNKSPVDHYGRSFYLAADSLWHNDRKCVGSMKCHDIMLSYTKNLMSVYRDKPYFMLSFFAQLTHGSVNLVGTMDDDFHDWLVDVQTRGFLNNTLLIVFSDHGPRFADVRQTVQGKQEERLPFFSFAFPPWFKQKYPEAYMNFLTNTKRLTTPFDIYPTLKDILKFPKSFGAGDLQKRSISLFSRVPLQRSCAHAQIEAHWCACLDWDILNPSDYFAQEGAKEFVRFINNYTASHRHLCAELSVQEVKWAARLQPNKKLLAFNRNADVDGFVPDLSSGQRATLEMLQLKIQTVPGNGLFEVSLSHNLQNGAYSLNLQDISRISKYGSQAHCIEQTDHDYRKYCYCKEPPPSKTR